jgi:23S rRNA pseudouridine2457 synthase
MPRRTEFHYVKFNKPFEVLCQFSPSQNRQTLKDFLPVPGIYPAGRLDYRTEGLLLLTSNPAVAHRLTDPRYDHPKTYLVQVEGQVTAAIQAALQEKEILPGELTRTAAVEIIADPDLPPRIPAVRNYHPTSWLKITLREGKKHQIRRMTAAAGFPTLRLVRVSIGSLVMQGLKPGEWRYLSKDEVACLFEELALPLSSR